MGSWAVQLANAVANTEKTKLLNDLQLRRFISGGKAVAKSDGEGLTFTLSSAGTASLMLRYRLSGGRRKEFMIGNDLVFLCRWRESNPGRCGFRLTKAKTQQADQIEMKNPG